MTRAAKLSLSQFYERHGKPVEATLPKNSGDGARDNDQCYSSKLADISIDTRKSQRGTRVNDAGCGQNGSRVDVDYDYYGAPKQSSYVPPQPPYPRCPAPLVEGPSYAGPGVTAKTASLANSDGYAESGYTSGATLSSGRSGPYTGPGQSSACAGPYYGDHTPAVPAAEDVWYPPPPPPPRRAQGSIFVQQQELPAAGATATGLPVAAGVPVAKGGSALVTFPAAAPPPPPPGRRQLLDAQQQIPPTAVGCAASAVTGQRAGVGLASEMANRASPAPANSAFIATNMPVAESRAADREVVKTKAKSPEPARTTMPVAAVEHPAAPAAPAGPKNEFAEKLAARAIANASKAKSSLLAGSSLTSSGSLSSALPAICGTAAAGEDTNGVFVAPEHPFGRPKLNLKPRSTPLPDSAAATPSVGNTSSSSASSDSGTDVGEKDSTISVASSAAGRPRLQLQPRSLPLPRDAGSTDASGRPGLNLKPGGSTDLERSGSTAAEEIKRKPSVFGAAKPREEVLKERGVNPVDADLARTSRTASSTIRLSEAAVAKLGGTYGGVGRYGGSHSSVSGIEDEWQVAGHGRKGSSKLACDASDSAAQLLGDDPFFGSCSKGFTAPAPRAFDREIMRDKRGYSNMGSGSYGDETYGSYGRKGHHFGSPAGGWGGKGACADAGNDWEGDVFTRALPTRQAPFAL